MILKSQNPKFILRPIKLSDAKSYWETMQDKEIKRGFMSTPDNFKEAKKEVKELINRNKRGVSEVFVIIVNKEYVGSVILEYQNWDKTSNEGRMHLWVNPKFRGKGLATSAINIVLKHGFKEIGFKKIYAQCKASNTAVIKVIKKCGFKKEKVHLVEGIKKILWVKKL